MAQIGTAWVQITPSFRGFNKAVGAGVGATMPAAGAAAGTQFGRGMASGVGASAPVVGAAAGKAGASGTAAMSAAGTAAGAGFTTRATAAIGAGSTAMATSAATAGTKVGTGFGGGMLAGATRALGPLAAIFGGGAIVGAGLGRLTGIEDAQAKLQGLGHDGEAVQTIMDNSLGSVKGTAFGLADAATISASAVAAGIKPGEDLQRVLSLVGDAATIGGTSLGDMGAIFNKVAASNRAGMEEINQLSDRGIPILQWLAEEYDTTAIGAREMVSKGEVDFATFSRAIEDNIGGAALKSGETTRGAFANMRAAVGRFGAEVVEGPFSRSKNIFVDLTDVIDRATAKVGPALERMAGWFRDNAYWLKPLAAAAAGAAGALLAFKAVVLPVQLATGAVMALNAAMRANPIGVVVTAIGFLVGALIYLYKNNETARAVMDRAWAGIKQAVSLAWERVIKPAFTAMTRFVTETLAPAAMWLWRNVIVPAFNGISSAVKWAWNNVIKPAVTALVWYWRNVLAPAATWLWKNIIKPAFDGISFAVKVAWNFIKLQLDLLVFFFRNVVAPVATWLWKNVFAPAFDGIAAKAKWVWDRLKPIFQALGNFIRDNVAPAFRSGVSAIETAWNRVMEVARKPVNFVIDTVYNNGIRAGFEAVAKAVGSDARLPRMSTIGVSVAGRAAASTGAARGVVARARGGFTTPGMTLVGEQGPELVDFATPGRVYTAQQTARMMAAGTGDVLEGVKAAVSKGTDIVKGAASMLADPFAWVKSQVAGFISRIPGGGAFGGIVKAIPGKILDLLKDKLGSFFGGGADGAGMGSTPGGGRGWQWQMATLRSRFPGLRLNSGYRPGAITALGNPSMHGMGRAVDVPPRMDVFNWIRENYGAQTKQLIFSPANGRQIINGRSTNIGGVTRANHWDHVHWGYDQGGWLPPGVTQVANATRKPEAILNPQQWADISALAARGSAPVGGDTYQAFGTDPVQVVALIQSKQRVARIRNGAR